MKRSRWILVASAWVTVLCALPGGAETVPASRPADAAALEAQMEATVRRLVAGLGADDYKVRQAAETALAALHEKYLDLILTSGDEDDQEAQVRVKRVLQRIAVQAAMKQALASLAPQQRRKLAAFRKAHSALCIGALSAKSLERVQAVRSIVELEDPDALAEPVVLLSLLHENDDIAAAGAHAACSGQYRSDAVVDALASLLVRKASDSWGSFGRQPGKARPHLVAAKALKQIRSKRASLAVVGLLCGEGFISRDKTNVLASILIALDEKRALPHLIPLIERAEVVCIGGPGQAGKWSITMGDTYLMTVIRLTGQNPHVYGFRASRFSSSAGQDYGFDNQEKRSKAVQRFKKWWAANRNRPPYKDLKPLKLLEAPKEETEWRVVEPAQR